MQPAGFRCLIPVMKPAGVCRPTPLGGLLQLHSLVALATLQGFDPPPPLVVDLEILNPKCLPSMLTVDVSEAWDCEIVKSFMLCHSSTKSFVLCRIRSTILLVLQQQ